MNFAKSLIILNIFFCLAGCSLSESKLQSILDVQIGRTRYVERTRLELDSVLGKDDSKLKASILTFIEDRVEIEYSDIIIDGKKARVKVTANIPKAEEVSTLISRAGFMPREKILDMTIEDLFVELAKNYRTPAGVAENISSETYEFSIDFEKNKDWMANSEQLSKAFSKRHLISKK